MDCDIVVVGDVSKLYFTDVEDYLAAGVVEQFKQTGDSKILNFLVGQVMKETRGKANAGDVMAKIKSLVNG